MKLGVRIAGLKLLVASGDDDDHDQQSLGKPKRRMQNLRIIALL
jgi:hypothetical protein